MTNVIELAKQAGLCTNLAEMGASSIVYTLGVDGVTVTELERFAALVRNAALTEAIDKARIFGLGLPIAQIERLIKALESLKEPTP